MKPFVVLVAIVGILFAALYREMATYPTADYPDAQETKQQPLKFIPVDEHLRLSDSQMTIDVYRARGNIHMAEAVFAYVPAAELYR